MKITLIGSGNVGAHLGKRFWQQGISVHQVYSRNIENAERLGNKINAKFTNELRAIDNRSNLYILAVKDDVIEEVAQKLSQNKGMSSKLVVHTSGAASSEMLAPYFKHYGIFYPLQTFSKNKKIDFDNIPICIEAGNKKDLKKLRRLGGKISQKVAIISDKERAILHIAAVFVNNFTNHLFHIGQEITRHEGIDFDLLKPLMKETVLKIENFAPKEMQTGPARRKDKKTIKKHLKYLKKFPEYAHLYALLTKSIQDAYCR